jgi:hypothetical protein
MLTRIEMAGKTQGDKIDELSQAVATLTERVDTLRREVAEVSARTRDLTTRVALIEQQVSDMRRVAEESSRRWWAFLPALLGAVIGGILTFLGQWLLVYLRK